MTPTPASTPPAAANREGLFAPGVARALTGLCALGALAFFIGLAVDPRRAWGNLLFHNLFFLCLAMAAGFFLAMNVLTRAAWPAVLRRVPEAMTGYVPVGAALMLVSALGLGQLYEWVELGALGEDPIIASKAWYLNPPFFIIRMVAILAIWAGLTRYLTGALRRQAEGASAVHFGRTMRAAALFTVVFILTFTIAAIDWIMSLEPHWYSTLFPWYVMSSAFAGALAAITLLAMRLSAAGRLEGLNAHHLHDLGKYVFAFSVFWGYLWFCQFMLIWYANIPEEVSYYLRRGGPWSGLLAADVVINLALPFVLLPAAFKRARPILFIACALVVAGHWLDFYLLVMPPLMESGPRLGWMEIGVGLGVASAFLLACDRTLRAAPIVPRGDPFLARSLAHRV